MPLRVLMAGVVAAPIAYYFAAAGLFPDSKSARGPLLASIGPGAVAPAPRPDTARDDDGPGISSRAETPAPRMALSPPMPATSFPVPAAPGPASAAPESSPGETPAVQPARELDPEDIQLLIKQGEQFVAAGDLVTARVVFRRAAEADNATAALALGATYDPIVLAKLGTRGIVADVEQARSWYEKAKAFGSPDAPRRLELLANR